MTQPAHSQPERDTAPASLDTDGSVFIRVALAVYALLILYASWYPFSGWHEIGVAPFAYLTAPPPRYWTGFDIVTNVLAYVPFGMLVVFAIYPSIRRAAIVLPLVLMIAAFWSGTMEAVQTFLPTRVSSNLDLLTNVGGALIGAIIGQSTRSFFLGQSRLQQVRSNWFSREASRGLIVVLTWPLAQIYPQGYLFGHGQLVPILSEWLKDLTGISIEPLLWIWPDLQLRVDQFWLAESIITACGLCGAVLTLACLLRKKAPAILLCVLMIGAALAVKSLSNALLFQPENMFVWLTPGAQAGLVFGTIMLIAAHRTTPTYQRRIAIVMLLISFIAVNLIVPNPYFVVTLQRWVQGKFLSFNGATQFMSLLWPFLAMWFLLHSVHHRKSAAVS